MIDRTLQKITRDIRTLEKKVSRLSALEKLNIAGVHNSIIPATDSAHDLGSVTHKWANVYADTIAGVLTGAEWEFSGTSMKIDANSASQHTILYIRNDDGTYEVDLDVERNIIVGGTVDGVDIATRDGDLTTAESEINTLQTDLTTLEAAVVILAPATNARNLIQPSTDAVALTLKADAAQTENILEIHDSGGAPMSGIDERGALFSDLGTVSTNLIIGPDAGNTSMTLGGNVIIGSAAGIGMTDGDNNVIIGYMAGQADVGVDNVYVGEQAGLYNTGASNTFVGSRAGRGATGVSVGANNTCVGFQAGYSITDGTNNMFLGRWAGRDTTSGDSSVYVGRSAGRYNNGLSNMMMGNSAGLGVSTVSEYNYYISIGYFSSVALTTATAGIAIGWRAGAAVTTEGSSIFIGNGAGQLATGGTASVMIGAQAGQNSTSAYSVFLGRYAGKETTDNNRLVIDNADTATPLIYGEFDGSGGMSLATYVQAAAAVGFTIVGAAGQTGNMIEVQDSGTTVLLAIQSDGDLQFGQAAEVSTTAGNLTIAPAGDIILNPTGDGVLPGSHRDIDLGETATWFAAGYIDQLEVGTIKSVVFETQEVHVFNGSFMIAKSSASLAIAKTFAASGADTFVANDTNKFAVGDILRLKDLDSDTWLEVTSIASDPTISVTVESGGSESFVAGNTVVNYGTSGQGMMLLTADDIGTVGGPAISVFDHAGAPWTTTTEYVRLGNLNGWGGFSGDKWGVGLGEYAADIPNFYVNASDGVMKMRIYTTDYMVFDYNGGSPTAEIVGTLDVTSPGKITAGSGAVTLDSDGITIEAGTDWRNRYVIEDTDEMILWVGGGAIVGDVTRVDLRVIGCEVDIPDTEDSEFYIHVSNFDGDEVVELAFKSATEAAYLTGSLVVYGTTTLAGEVSTTYSMRATNDLACGSGVYVGDKSGLPADGTVQIYLASGDPRVIFDTSGTDWAIGVDDSDSDMFKINNNTTLVDTSEFAIASGGKVFINENANAEMTVGLTINQGVNDDEIITLKSSTDVDHGMTTLTETDTWGTIKKAQADAGGMQLTGYSDLGGYPGFGLDLVGIIGEAADTTKSSSGYGVINLNVKVKNGTGATAVGSDGNLVSVRNNNTTVFLFDAEGSAHAEVEWIAFDEHDDVALLDTLECALVENKDVVKEDFAQFLTENRQQLEDLNLVRFDRNLPGRAMVNTTRLSMLLVGAMRQMSARVETLEVKLLGGN